MNSIWRYAFERAIKEGHSRDAAARFAERAVSKWVSEVLGECREPGHEAPSSPRDLGRDAPPVRRRSLQQPHIDDEHPNDVCLDGWFNIERVAEAVIRATENNNV